MFPRYPKDDRPGPTKGATARLNREESPCPSCTGFLDALDGAAQHVDFLADPARGSQMKLARRVGCSGHISDPEGRYGREYVSLDERRIRTASPRQGTRREVRRRSH